MPTESNEFFPATIDIGVVPPARINQSVTRNIEAFCLKCLSTQPPLLAMK